MAVKDAFFSEMSAKYNGTPTPEQPALQQPELTETQPERQPGQPKKKPTLSR